MEVPAAKKNDQKKLSRAKKERPAGGKALARLQQFELERGLEPKETEPVTTKSYMSFITENVRTAKNRPGTKVSEKSQYLEAYQYMQKRIDAQPVPLTPVATGWRPLGPFSIPHGQTYGQGAGNRPPVSGRISAVAVDPSDESHILIGSAGGGVWESRDNGKTWQPRTDNQPSLAMGAIAFDPANPKIVYAGTGEGDFFASLGAGILRSTDGGTTWAMHSPPNPGTPSPFPGNGFYELQVDPLDGSHIIAATTTGLFESADGGVSWVKRISQKTYDISIHPPVPNDPTSTDEVFAGCSNGVSRSVDGGTTWTSVSLPEPPTTYARMEICHAPSDGSIVYIFALHNNAGYLWRRNTFGGSFIAVSLPSDLAVHQGWYDWFAAVAPNNPDIIYLGAIDVHKGVGSPGGNWSWTNISSKNTGDSIHPDQHAIAFSPVNPNTIFIGNDGGIYRSTDGGTTFQSLNKGLCITEFEYLAQHPQFEAYLLGGTQDNGTLRYEGSEVWFHIADGDGGDCGVNANAPYTCYHSYFKLGLERSVSGGGWGEWSMSWWPTGNIASLFYPPLEVRGNIVVQAGQTVFISTDTGTTWTSVALPGSTGQASALAIPADNLIYVGTDHGSIYSISFSGTTLQGPAALTSPRAGFISDMLVDPANPGRIWVTYSSRKNVGHVYRSDNTGSSWTDVSANLPDIAMNAIEIDPVNSNRLWVAADVGVWETKNAGTGWQPFSNQLPNSLAKDLMFHAPSRLLRVATQNRGVWEIAVDAGTMPDVEVYLRDSVVDTGRLSPSPTGVPDPFKQGKYTYWWECTDIKVDAPPYLKTNLNDVDFEVFEDDHGVAYAGLVHRNAQRGRKARVYVQVHNRGIHTAQNVAVKVFFADTSVTLPDLPSRFWTNFPNNVLPSSSPWQVIGPHKIIPSIEPGKAEIIGFEWDVPQSVADNTCIIAIISAENDSIDDRTLVISELIRNNKKAGLKNLTIVNPIERIPRVRIARLYIWPTKKRYPWTLKIIDTGKRKKKSLVQGFIFSKAISAIAHRQELKKAKFPKDIEDELKRISRRIPKILDGMDLEGYYPPPQSGVFLKKVNFTEKGSPETLLVLIDPEIKTGTASIVITNDEDQITGGFTFEAR